jgi:hypothetical protein
MTNAGEIETHPFNQQIEAQQFMQENNVQIESWGLFAEGKNNIFQNELLLSIAGKLRQNGRPGDPALADTKRSRRYSEISAEGEDRREFQNLRLRAECRRHGRDHFAGY